EPEESNAGKEEKNEDRKDDGMSFLVVLQANTPDDEIMLIVMPAPMILNGVID
ncbi:MAG: hypothetical protein IIB03_11195, partial [Acidobacteria bacterium]|nr:hypothetical protein [Acidobacteriota bacterium]